MRALVGCPLSLRESADVAIKHRLNFHHDVYITVGVDICVVPIRALKEAFEALVCVGSVTRFQGIFGRSRMWFSIALQTPVWTKCLVVILG
jgi:hypothetical protein